MGSLGVRNFSGELVVSGNVMEDFRSGRQDCRKLILSIRELIALDSVAVIARKIDFTRECCLGPAARTSAALNVR